MATDIVSDTGHDDDVAGMYRRHGSWWWWWAIPDVAGCGEEGGGGFGLGQPNSGT